MNQRTAICAGLSALLIAGTVFAAPPGKPIPITSHQFAAVRDIERQPQHHQVLNVRATFQSERERIVERNLKSDDVTTAATFIGYPAAIITILIVSAM
jgi:hypothetical protein